ncbi:MAG: hypothetical protein E6J71_15465 [Deltaproteobacteria bacterium]|nr:MAG: hypothetical protein E6J77_18540 [Deltaproteobacteria bacterium]TMB16869.1 MAG: hypothetical protein E6J71_15465 [Deltaproteobacteria bacterium]
MASVANLLMRAICDPPNLVVVSRTVETCPLRPLTDEAGDFYGPEEGEVNEKNLVAGALAPTRRAKENATELRQDHRSEVDLGSRWTAGFASGVHHADA